MISNGAPGSAEPQSVAPSWVCEHGRFPRPQASWVSDLGSACGTISEVPGLSRDGSPRIWRRRNKYVHPRAGEVLTNNHQVLERASENSVPSSLNTKKERGWLVGHLRMKVISIWAAVA